MIKEYQQKIQKHQKLIKSNEMVSTWIGCIKLGIVIVLIFALYKSIGSTTNYMYVFLGGILFYIIFSIWQSSVKRKIRISKNAMQIFQNHLHRIHGEWIDFKDTGEEYVTDDHLYANDLDIVGKKSLFQMLNITNTYHGRKQLIKDLLSPQYNRIEIQERQEAINELSKNIPFVNEVEQKTIEINNNDKILKIIETLNTKNTITIPPIFQKLLSIIPLLATICFVVGLVYRVLPLVVIGFTFIILQGIFWIVSLAKLQGVLQTIRKIPFGLKEYTNIFHYLCQQEFSSKKLKEIKNILGEDHLSSSNAMKDLDKIITMISVGNNFVIYGILNVFFLWDYLCYIRFQKWQEHYAQTCELWFEALGEVESLMSFSIIPMVCQHSCLPQIVEKEKTIKVLQLGHPLLQEEKRINNDFSLDNNICIISGSNMSGKTTFMRTLGINLLLARIGSFVCAKQMETSIFNLAASMRIADNLNEGVSTFYAELKNIKRILDIAANNENTFFMIDEIFRGTNSVDRLEGAQMVLKKLHALQCSGVITTHDLELCQMDKQYSQIQNYHFSEMYKDNEIIFSYKLQAGISTTTNAKQLMKMLGIL